MPFLIENADDIAHMHARYIMRVNTRQQKAAANNSNCDTNVKSAPF